ncbi:MAG: response regulator [Terracidiphilus sp.]
MDENSMVYLLDDDRRALESMLDMLRASGYRVEPFNDPKVFVQAVRRDVPSCLIADYNVGGTTGFDILRKIRFEETSLAAIFVSGCRDVATAVRAMKRGATDFLTKPINPDALLTAVGAALDEARGKWRKLQSMSKLNNNYQRLTPREREILPLIVSGLLNKQTAYELGRAEITIRIHRGNIMRKMEAQSLPHLVRQAAALGIGYAV